MKICLVHHEYPEETSMGGIATYQRMLALTLKKLGNQVTVISASMDEDKEEYDEGIHIIRFSKCIQYDTIEYMTEYRWKVANKLHEMYLSNELDIIESPEMGAECLNYIERFHDVPVVCKLHTSFEIWAEFNETTLPEEVHKQLVNWEREYVKKADVVTSCTNLLYTMMKNRNQIQRNDVIILGNPANVENFNKINCEKDNSILYVGGLEQRKGVLVLAKAIPIVLEQIPNIKFKFVGANTNSNDKNISTIDYIKDIVPSKFHSNLEFVGHIDNKEITKYCSKSIIGIVPSSFDNLPYVAMEELLCELPLIASDNTGVIEMIENNESGVLFKNGDYNDLAKKIIFLYGNEDMRKKMGILGRKAIIAKFSPQKIALKNIDIYQDAINKFQINKIFKNKVDKISHIPYGLANFVYKVEVAGSVYIAKCYREGMKKNSFKLIIYDKKQNDFTLCNNKFDDQNITIMNYIEGEHKYILTRDEINIIFDFMNFYHKTNYNVPLLKDKIEKFNNGINPKRKNICDKLNSFWHDNYSKINLLLSEDLIISHGDLAPTNILFSKKTAGFIDFDESCLAPRYYDLAVFLVKYCLMDETWNMGYARNIIDMYKMKNNDFQEHEFRLTVLIYLYKIIMEKFYWEGLGLTDLDDKFHKKDKFMMYYNLFEKLVVRN